MQQTTLPTYEEVTTQLRELFQGLGYTRFPMRRFEEYAFYLDNKSFLKTEGVLTFSAPDGRLMALKPDVTLSIVKHAGESREGREKLYYTESVYRVSQASHEFSEIEQMGLECLGNIDVYAVCEVLRLALESLRLTGRECLLEISHMGFADGLLQSAGLSPAQKEALCALIRQKNEHELSQALLQMQVPDFYAGRILRLAGLGGDFEQTLAQAEAIAVSGDMQQALSELSMVYQALSALGFSENLRLDFSIMNDLTYYNGIVFQGYVLGAPRAVLAGGRYDNLMRRMGKRGDGIGFALYLDEISRLLYKPLELDADAALLYTSSDNPVLVSRAAWELSRSGLQVTTLPCLPEKLRVGKVYQMENGEAKEVDADA